MNLLHPLLFPACLFSQTYRLTCFPIGGQRLPLADRDTREVPDPPGPPEVYTRSGSRLPGHCVSSGASLTHSYHFLKPHKHSASPSVANSGIPSLLTTSQDTASRAIDPSRVSLYIGRPGPESAL